MDPLAAPSSVEPFVIDVSEAVLGELRDRIRNTRWPDPAPGSAWQQGTDLTYLRRLLAYWTDGFDWRAREAALNRYTHFRLPLDGVPIHFVHARAVQGHGIPLILSHGWPSAFTELLPLVGPLTNPMAHGLAGPAFDLVIPSLPGYAFSGRPARPGVNYRYVAGLWHRLMRTLGYARYGVGGGDFGAGIATLMALDDPDAVIGVHLTTIEPDPYHGDDAPLSPAESRYLTVNNAWWESEGGYKAIQSSRPQTLGYGLTDSPAGLAAWIVEKWWSWTDHSGELDQRIDRDFVLELLTIYWATRTITTSMRDYYDNRWHAVRLGRDDRVSVPTAVAVFTHQHAFEGRPPREWAQRRYRLHRWTPMPRGGHFAAVEEPGLVADDIAAFFGSL